jgi:hypothetical protein
MEKNLMFLPLDAERLVAFKDGSQEYRLVFRRIREDDWKRFFTGCCLETEAEGSVMKRSVESDNASVELVENALLRAEGYRTRQGTLMEAPNWKARIPVGHKLLAGRLLQSVGVAASSGERYFDSDIEEVELEAAWGTPENGMQKFAGLVHLFGPVTPEQQRRYFRARSESRVEVKGSKNMRTVYAGRRDALITIYDELITGVEGYTVNGEVLSKEQIKKEMDAAHKVVAAARLFEEPEEDGVAAA